MKCLIKVFLPSLAVLFTVILIATAEAQSAHQINKERLEERVKELLKEANVDLREEVEDLFLLADIYTDEGNEKDAIRLYQGVLA